MSAHSIAIGAEVRDDIAIVGMACRFPGARDYEQFWRNQHDGVFCVTEVPPERWSTERYYSSRREDDNKTVSKWGGFMADIDQFDAGLFHVSPREAELMDPQQRIMLELAWTCIEDAGYAPSVLRGSDMGVYLGVCNFDYKMQVERAPASVEAHMSTGVHTTLIPNRISYEFDLRGPSLPIDTACSSSLVALAQAVHALRRGECSAALVGGVSVLLNPTHFISFSKAGMLSPRGACRSFDEGADGYVRGEGAGIIMLKPLQAALRDGDRIHGVVKGVAVNHGGKVATVTSPNPFAQARCVEAALCDAGISPAAVQYIEAHGTGTPKGDPIEMHGLMRAYASQARVHGDTLAPSSCAIGSVKTSIGHLEAAAGIAGIIKVLLAMRHAQLPALLHFERPNPRIRLEGSPFYFLDKPRTWPAGEDGARTAGVSSFGFGGVNAHVVLAHVASAQPSAKQETDDGVPLLFVLSARNRDSLAGYAQALAQWIESRAQRTDDRPFTLAALAHSLQRRETHDERLAIEAADPQALTDALLAYATGREATGCWHGNVKQQREVAQQRNREVSSEVLTLALQTRDHARIAAWWVAGVSIADWLPYFAAGLPHRLTLPAYVFTRKRYWYCDEVAAPPAPSAAAPLHPLVHSAVAGSANLQFETTLTGAEFYLEDHRLHGERVLPGVAYLEMARCATLEAMPAWRAAGLQLHGIVWSRPLVVRSIPERTTLTLTRHGASMRWEVQTTAGIHATGLADPLGDLPPAPDLGALRSRLSTHAGDVDALYARLAKAGLAYGPAHRAITAYWSNADQALARVVVEAGVSVTAAQFVLHPGLMDAALQACLTTATGSVERPPVPFALERLSLPAPAAPTPPALWAWIRRRAGGHAGHGEQCFDIDVVDEQGLVHAALRGLSLRVLSASAPARHAVGGQKVLLLAPEWRRTDAGAGDMAHPAARLWQVRKVLLAGFAPGQYHGELAQLAAAHALEPAWQLQQLAQEGAESVAALYHRCTRALVDVLRSAMTSGQPSERHLLQLLVPDDGPSQLLAGLAGMLRTAQLENPRIVTQLLRVNADADALAVYRLLQDGAALPHLAALRTTVEGRGAAALRELKVENSAMPWREGGVYLITGGAGALGRMFAQEIGGNVQRATLILTGRAARPLAAFDAMRGAGLHVEYHVLDLADGCAVKALVADVVQRHGGLHGVLHCAGMVRDEYLVRKQRDACAEVLAPKVDGTVHLDDATHGIALDLFVLFSSIAGVLGNVGQADYAAANGFLDCYAHYRSSRRTAGYWGHTISINWPLWREGGMKVDEATAQMLAQRLGMGLLDTPPAMTAFYRALASGQAQVLVLSGDAERLRTALLQSPAPASQQAPAQGAPMSCAELEASLVSMAARLLKLDEHELDTRTQLSEYGFDSIAYTGLANRVNERYDVSLSPAVFFDYPTIAGMAGYLLERHGERFAVAAAPAVALVPAPGAAPDAAPEASPVPAAQPSATADDDARMSPFMEAVPAPSPRPDHGTEAVAIVGMSGSFPMAADVGAFWRNLEEGRDCISEIPAQRWDWKAIYGDPAAQPNASNVKWGGFIDDVDAFDPLFFGLSPREALMMDPQQRLLMQHAWQAIEDAGYAPSSLAGSNTGVFVATASTGYDSVLARAGLAIEGFSATGIVPSVGPNRLSYLLNLRGPSEPVETACSSSLVAIHRAVTAMQAGDCAQAIVGGVNTIVAPQLHISFNKAGMLAKDGRCKTFSAAANGYVRGEGVGMLFLKPLSAAEADGDHIYGVILGSAENHGGRANSLTSPSAHAQAQVISKAWQRAGVPMHTAGYLEAHGTGTPLGDPVEINGIRSAFEVHGASGENAPRCAIASVKSNIGHLELAAGVAGVIKVLLQLRHQCIAASLHCEELNAHIDLTGSRFYVPREAQPWPAPTGEDGKPLPRRAGISSFGFGGVNAHVVLQEYASRPATVQAAGQYLVPLSAKTPAALRRYAQALLDFLAAVPDCSLLDLSYTLQVGRDVQDERLALVVESRDALAQGLRDFLAGDASSRCYVTGQVARSREVLGAYAEDEDLQATMALWLAKGKVRQFLGMWVRGVAFDWASLYRTRAPEQRPHRISAPTYPFARERLWPAVPATATQLAPPSAPDTCSTQAGDGDGEELALDAIEVTTEDPVLETLLALGRGKVSVDDALAVLSTVA